MPVKPLNQKAYGSIGHLPGSRRGPADHGVHEGQGRICTEQARDKNDTIIVQEKLDGSNVAVANINGAIVPLIRSGYLAEDSHYRQHHIFNAWVHERWEVFDFLNPGERVCGEWLAQAHGTRYDLKHDPFVVFDLMTVQPPQNSASRTNRKIRCCRALSEEVIDRVGDRLPMPRELHRGSPISIDAALLLIGDHGWHGAIDKAEGMVWRVERQGVVDFLAKYVRPDKIDGAYLESHTGGEAIWNWRPAP